MFNSLLLMGIGLIGMIYTCMFPDAIHTNHMIFFVAVYFTGLIINEED